MKFLLAVLLSFVMTEAPVLAIHGGYTLPGSTSLVGTYAGILVPVSDDVLVTGATDFGTNSLGLFTLSVPSEGLGTGDAVIFSDGRTFTGTIDALANPASAGALTGVLNATFDYSLTVTTGTVTTTTSVTASAQGSFDAEQVQNPSSVGGNGIDLTGTSLVDINQGFVSGTSGVPVVTEQVTFLIDGFLQSTTATTTTTTGDGTGTTGD